ncbi:methionine synthase [Cryptosporangium aurantiacum]|uniref:Cobalamin-independent synthase, Catalytic domain n=1 Tax=Cryptosporangium aurantiacum TaxID=134849 RepID=A0A1M7HIN2_9ACTN|nr:methionine synthase [Cryptosporangium aurantiacum]SHM28391.1 Cobalamin-independent synthase, Catalytic domain [Cryptosporangium aurantiacum]
MEATYPWPAGAATGVGSLPGTDVVEAVRTVLGELPDLPHLPELPARGPGSDLIGRGASFLVELPVDLQPSGWRLVDRPGRDLRRALDLLERDLDALTEQAEGYTGPLKVQVAGVWTLAASIELHNGAKALSDPGAVRDLAASLLDGLVAHLADVRRRVPGASLLMQLDEPSLPAVLAGRIKTPSGYGTVRRPEESVVEQVLATLVEKVGAPVVFHCCASDVPWALFRRTGAAAVSADLTLLGPPDRWSTRAIDTIGEELDAGLGLFAGVVPAVPPAAAPNTADARAARRAQAQEMSDPAASVTPVRTLWQRLGFDPAGLASQVVTTPTCGLAGATGDRARAVLAQVRAAGRSLVKDPEA